MAMDNCRDTVAGPPRTCSKAGTLNHPLIVEVIYLLDHALDATSDAGSRWQPCRPRFWLRAGSLTVRPPAAVKMATNCRVNIGSRSWIRSRAPRRNPSCCRCPRFAVESGGERVSSA